MNTEFKNDLPWLLEQNYTSLYDLTGELLRCNRGVYDDIHWVDNNGAWPSRIYGLNLTEDTFEEKLVWIIKGMKEGKLPRKIGTSQFTRPENYKMYFDQHHVVLNNNAQGMGINIDSLNDSYNCKEDLHIRKLSALEDIQDFATIVVKVLFQQSQRYEADYIKALKVLMEASAIELFGGYIKDQMVATSMVYYDGKVAGIYHVATANAYRGNGIGKQMTIAPLKAAKKKGYNQAVLFASEAGEYVYKQLGFEPCGVLGRYVLGED